MYRKAILCLLLLSLILVLVTNTGCYGPSVLTTGVAKWHSELDTNKYVKEAVFLPIFLLVYPVTGFVDYFILNSIEWWTAADPETEE